MQTIGSTPDPAPKAWYFVPRQESSRALRRRLLQPNRRAPVIAVVGMAGVGKSTLVADLVEEPAVLKRYQEGVLWATLGLEEPRILGHLQRFLVSCGDSYWRAGDLEEASQRLRKRLSTGAFLVVLDDVWRAVDVQPFLGLGPGCTLIITTRDWAVAESVGAWAYELRTLSNKQALELIQRRLQRRLGKAEKLKAAEVAEALGYLPLSLVVACARIEEGDTWERLSAELQHESARLHALEPPETPDSDSERTKKQLSLVATFNLSLRSLSDGDRAAFARLSLLAEDVPFTQHVAANLWQTTPEQAEMTLRLLRRKELLLAHGTDGVVRSYRLHDEQWNAGRRILRCSNEEGHRSLVETYRNALPTSQWSDVQDDGYIHEHLTWHMTRAGLAQDLHQLLREERDGKNAWFAVRQAQLGAYIRDLDLAATVASEASPLEVRYALIRSSVASLSVNVPVDLVLELVQRGRWSMERALGYALSLPLPHAYHALVTLAELAEEPYRGRCIDAALEHLRQAPDKGKVGLLQCLPLGLEEPKLGEVMRLAKGVQEYRSSAIIVMLRHFANDGRFEEVFRELEALGNDLDGSVLSVSGLLDGLPTPQVDRLLKLKHDAPLQAKAAERLALVGELDRALDLIEGLPEYLRAESLEAIADRLDESRLQRAESLAREIVNLEYRSRALAAVFSRDEEPNRTGHLRTLWRDLLHNYSRESERAQEIVVARLTAPILKEYLDTHFPRGKLGEKIVERLAQLGYHQEALRALERSESSLRFTIQTIVPYLGSEHLIRLGVTNPEQDGITLAYMLPRWAELGHGSEAIDLLQRVGSYDFDFRTQAASRMAKYLDNGQLDRLLAERERIGDHTHELRLLVELASFAPEELAPFLFDPQLESAVSDAAVHCLASALPVDVALKLRESFTKPVHRLAICTGLGQPPGDLLLQGLEAVYEHLSTERQKVKDEPLSHFYYAQRLAAPALRYFRPGLEKAPDSVKNDVLGLGRKALKEYRGLLDAPELYVAFWRSEQIVPLILKCDIPSRPFPSEMTGLAHLAAEVPPHHRHEVEEVVTQWCASSNLWDVLEGLTEAPKLTPRLLDLTLEKVRTTPKYATLGFEGARLAAHLARHGRTAEAVEIAGRVPEEYDNVLLDTVVGLAAHLPAPHHLRYLNDAWARIARVEYVYRSRNDNDADQLRRLVPRAVEQPRESLAELWHRAVQFLTRRSRPELLDYLCALAPVIHKLSGKAGVVETWRALLDVSRWWP